MKTLFLFVLVYALIQKLPAAAETRFVVTDPCYGAVADGTKDNAPSIQAAINAAGKAGCGTVVIPAAAKPYACGPLELASNVSLLVDAGAVLQMLPYKQYPATVDFITIRNLHDVKILGKGSIDGQGAPWWQAFDERKIPRPKTMLAVVASGKVEIRDITLDNPPNTHVQLRGKCSGVGIVGITISAPEKSHNTDGIDLAGTGILIDNCDIACGDDNIALGGSSVASSGIRITNCRFGCGHGLSIGSHTSGGLQNLFVDHCSFRGTSSGIRMKSARDRGGVVRDLVYSNITMADVGKPIYITSYYPNNTMPGSVTADKGQVLSPKTPFWKNITIRNLVATSGRNDASGVIWGLPEAPVENLVLDHVSISAARGMTIVHTKGLQLAGGTVFKVPAGVAPLLKQDAN